MPYKTTHELTADQMEQLKQDCLCRECEEMGVTPSWDELADAGDRYTDEYIHDAYRGVSFTDDYFWCSAA